MQQKVPTWRSRSAKLIFAQMIPGKLHVNDEIWAKSGTARVQNFVYAY